MISLNIEDTLVETRKDHPREISLERVVIQEEPYFVIRNYHEMRPFFMSIVSHTDMWMFISSSGGLTAGRKNADQALFPYYTVDKVTESADLTGSKTILRVHTDEGDLIWEPLSDKITGKYRITRNLYKNLVSNKIRFEEINHDLKLTFWYEWNTTEQFGFVKKAGLANHGQKALTVSILDGIQNILPGEVGSDLQNRASNLVDAYKRNELVEKAGLGLYALSAFIVDKAEPSESLRANVVWSAGFEDPVYLLSSFQLDSFRRGGTVRQERDIKGEKGAYFIHANINLQPGISKEWRIIADVRKDQSAVVDLIDKIESDPDLIHKVHQDIKVGTQKLISLNASSDALQCTKDIFRDARHFSNTLFNVMRGGVFDLNYEIEKKDFLDFLANANSALWEKYTDRIELLGPRFSLFELRGFIEKQMDSHLTRHALEYLPLKFSRRHGDPSRPWNQFSINIRDHETGEKILDYEGNWRDLFQNWEALAYSFPEFIEGMIFKFLNASTFDGYNPYRVTKDGFDWETIEPDDPWSYIGYWGDHQIIYLLKFLEISQRYFPDSLKQYLDKDLFVYANVPYRIKAYEEILRNPKDTIDFDHDADKKIRAERERSGSDGALIKDEQGEIYQVNFIEKILASVLAKLSNFIPEAGIWMNTQRPEWNDANNALVGNGASMVTLGYLRRMFAFLEKLLQETDVESVRVSNELVDFYKRVRVSLETYSPHLESRIDDQLRKTILDELGEAGSDFRHHVYQHGIWGRKRTISIDGLKRFIKQVLQYLDHSIEANRREDGMYHAYNLITVNDKDGIVISHLSEMLEGQVSALSSGFLSAKASLAMLDSLKSSKLFREDQYSYLLYPNKELPGFLEKNRIPEELVNTSALLTSLLRDENTQIIKKDVKGQYHFNTRFRNARDLGEAMDDLADSEYGDLISKERSQVLDIFEKVFHHKAFTGRSGTFYGYEGLGSIYWHMVSKLQLAVQECCLQAIEAGEDAVTVGRLLEHYYEINEGIGIHKPPSLYGAFPTDPYSHTPAGRGAQQPGMTGQVKEDIICRFGELGVFVDEGQLYFDPCLLRKNEFLSQPDKFTYFDVHQHRHQIPLEAGMLSFTFCQVPVVYKMGDANKLTVVKEDGTVIDSSALELDLVTSDSIFKRRGEVTKILVELNPDKLK